MPVLARYRFLSAKALPRAQNRLIHGVSFVSHLPAPAGDSPLSLDVNLWYRKQDYAVKNVLGLTSLQMSKLRPIQLSVDEDMTLSKFDLLLGDESGTIRIFLPWISLGGSYRQRRAFRSQK